MGILRATTVKKKPSHITKIFVDRRPECLPREREKGPMGRVAISHCRRRLSHFGGPLIGAMILLWISIAASGFQLPPEAHWQVAWTHFNEKRWHLAAEEFRLFLQDWPQHPKSAEARFYLAECLLQQGAFPEARDLYRQLLDQQGAGTSNPQITETTPRLPGSLVRYLFFRVAETTFLAKREDPAAWDEAAKWFEHFLSHWQDDPLAARAWNYLGQIRLQQGNVEEAAELLRRSLNRGPEDALADAARFRLAECLEKLNEVEEARRIYFALTHKNVSPLGLFAGFRLARILWSRGELLEAAETYEHLLRTWPAHPLTDRCRLALGHAYVSLGQSEKAIPVLLPLTAHPTFAWEAGYWLAVAQLACGDAATALKTLENLPEMAPEEPRHQWVELRKAEALLKLRQPAKARQVLEDLAAWIPAKPARSLSLDNQIPDVDEFDDHFCRLHVASYLATGQVYKAAQLARRYLAEGRPSSPETKLVLGQALLETGQWADATEILNELEGQNLSPSLAAEVQLALARACQLAGDLHRAAFYWQHIVDEYAGPPRIVAATALAQLARQQGNLVDARTILEKVSNEGSPPEDPLLQAELLCQLAAIALEESELQLARRYAGQIEQLPLPAHEKTRFLTQLAEEAITNHEYGWAKDVLIEASSAGDDTRAKTAIELQIAFCELQLGRPIQALSRLRGLVSFLDETHPLWGQAWLMLAQSAEVSGDEGLSLIAYQQALNSAEPIVVDQAAWRTAQLCERAGCHELANLFYSFLYFRQPTLFPHDELLFRRAVTTGRQHPAERLELLAELVSRFPESPRFVDASLYLAEEAIRLEDFQTAEKYIEAIYRKPALAEEGQQLRAAYLAGLVALGQRQWSTAEELLRPLTLAATFQLRVQALVALGEALYQQDRLAEAAEAFRHAIVLQQRQTAPGGEPTPYLAQAEMRLVEIAVRQDDLQAARELAVNFLNKYPEAPEVPLVKFTLGQIAYREGRLAEARVYLSQVVNTAVEHDLSVGAEAQLLLAESFYLADDYRTALREYLRLEILFPKSPLVPAGVLQAARCYEHLGLVDEAKRQYRRLLEVWPDTVYAAKAKEALRTEGLTAGSIMRKSVPK